MQRSMSRGLVGVVVLSGLLVPSLAAAHFTLVTPEASRSQDALGSPQKLAPCGDESGGTDTGKVTTYKAGDTIDVVIDEKIYHPGHYRIALSVNDRSELPPEPPVTAASTACGSAPIDPNPVFPVLADGLLVHTAPFSGRQTVKVKLPANVSCTHCTLQVLEFMSNHGLNNPGGCYYHHCADIAIQGGASDGGVTPPPAPTDAGAGGSADGGVTAADNTGGCVVATPSAASTSTRGAPALLLIVAAFLRRRRAA